jgi:DNA-directed RNA polymerase subunit RPC12/RpoP
MLSVFSGSPAKWACDRCSGKIFIDRAFCNYGNVEMFCIKCGKRWEFHYTDPIAKRINAIEKKRELAKNGWLISS